MEYYQPRFWGLDPLFSAKAKLSVGDVLTLQEYPDFPGVYCILNHPIINVHIMGDVVSISKRNLLIVYEVDDASGVVPCCQWRKTEGSDLGLVIPRLGQLVSVYGRMSEFRGERQIKVLLIVPEEDPNAEPLHWLEVAHLKRTVYATPFALPPGMSTASVPQLLPREAQPHSQSPFRRFFSPACNKSGDWKQLKAAVTQAVLQHLKAKHKAFLLGELRRDKELKMTCLEHVKKNLGPIWNETEVTCELDSIISELPHDGHVIPTNPEMVLMGREYEILSDERHLFPIIIDYMREKQQHPRAAKMGVPEEWIVRAIKLQEVYSQLPTSRIVAAIEHLCDTSQIFPVSHKVYKFVT